jgi:hypothetical protein
MADRRSGKGDRKSKREIEIILSPSLSTDCLQVSSESRKSEYPKPLILTSF